MSIVRITIFVIILLAYELAFAQCQFEKHLPLVVNTGGGIIKTSDNNYLVYTTARYDTLDPDHGNVDMCFVKMDTCGNVLWNKHYGHMTETDDVTTVIETDNGNFMVSGNASFQKTAANIRVMSLDKDGNKLWEQLYPNSNEAVSGSLTKCIAKNTFIISGRYAKQRGAGKKPENYGYMLEINQFGQIIRENKILFDTTGLYPGLTNCLLLNQNSYYFTHLNKKGGFYIINTDSNFNIRWIREPKPNFFNYYFGYFNTCFSSDSAYISCVINGDTIGGGFGFEGIMRIDLEGKLVNKLGYTVNDFGPTTIVSCSNNSYLVNKGPTTVDSNNNYTYYGGYSMVDSNFNTIWAVNSYRFTSLIFNGKKSITGVTSSERPNKTYAELYIARTDENGFMVNAPVIENKAKEKISVYPNPAKEELNIELLPNIKATQATLTDMRGKAIAKCSIASGKTKINTSELSTGIYLLQVVNEDGEIIYREKIVKE